MTATPRAFDEETGTWIWLGRWQRTALPVYPPALILNPDVGFAGESCRPSARLERHELVGRRRRVSGSDAARSNLGRANADRSEEHTSELQSLMRNSYAVFSLKKKKTNPKHRCRRRIDSQA